MQLHAAVAPGHDQMGGLEDRKVLRDGLTRHGHVRAELGQRLTVVRVEPIQQQPTARIYPFGIVPSGVRRSTACGNTCDSFSVSS